MKNKILYYHMEEIKPYMEETNHLMKELDKMDQFEVIDCMTEKNSNDMGLHLGKHWGTSTIIIIGQDNIPDPKTLIEMLHCEFDLCVNPCISYPASTALDRPMLNQIDSNGRMYEEYEEPEISHYGGTGVSKISLALQIRRPIVDFDWGFPSFDSHLFHLGFKNWHCHYPIHRHTKNKLSLKHWKDPS